MDRRLRELLRQLSKEPDKHLRGAVYAAIIRSGEVPNGLIRFGRSLGDSKDSKDSKGPLLSLVLSFIDGDKLLDPDPLSPFEDPTEIGSNKELENQVREAENLRIQFIINLMSTEKAMDEVYPVFLTFFKLLSMYTLNTLSAQVSLFETWQQRINNNMGDNVSRLTNPFFENITKIVGAIDSDMLDENNIEEIGFSINSYLHIFTPEIEGQMRRSPLQVAPWSEDEAIPLTKELHCYQKSLHSFLLSLAQFYHTLEDVDFQDFILDPYQPHLIRPVDTLENTTLLFPDDAEIEAAIPTGFLRIDNYPGLSQAPISEEVEFEEGTVEGLESSAVVLSNMLALSALSQMHLQLCGSGLIPTEEEIHNLIWGQYDEKKDIYTKVREKYLQHPEYITAKQVAESRWADFIAATEDFDAELEKPTTFRPVAARNILMVAGFPDESFDPPNFSQLKRDSYETLKKLIKQEIDLEQELETFSNQAQEKGNTAARKIVEAYESLHPLFLDLWKDSVIDSYRKRGY